MNPKGKFQEALKQFDNKDYRTSKKSCDKILEKSPTNEEALALKGLNVYYLNEKEEGKKLINQALKINLKSPVAWHFYALLHKEEGNYAQALKCYLQAFKNDPNNYNVVRDLSYLQLYLRQLNSFVEYSKKAVDMRSSLMVNWITYAFANAVNGNYVAASKLTELTMKSAEATLKKNEKHELIIFNAFLLNKMKEYEKAMQYLIDNKDDTIDNTIVYENIIKNAMLAKKEEIAKEYVAKALDINCENVNYLIWYFNLQIASDDFNAKTYDDLLSLKEDNKHLPTLLSLVQELKKKYPKGKLIARLELAFSTGDKFKEIFTAYFLNNVRITIPSFFINVKFIYQFQKYKLPIIESVLNTYLTSIEKEKKVTDELSTEANIAWVNFYASQHYDFLGEEEKALAYINKATDTTPSVVEFYMAKSKILKHGMMLEESAQTYGKAKTLDLGDRYLNAKYAKIFARLGDIDKSVEIMKEFVRDPLSEENVDYYQCMWFESECANAYLQNGKILHSHCLFKALLKHFVSMVDDQSDFYNFCLRRYMVNDLYNTIVYFDKISKNKYVYQSIAKLDLIYAYLTSVKEDNAALMGEFEEMKKENYTKYKFTDIKSLKEDIENDIYKALKKLQSISDREDVHFFCVKYFLIKKKVVMALKSLKLLSKNKKGFYYVFASKLFKEYATANKDKFNDAYVSHINEMLQAGGEQWEEKDIIKNVFFKLYYEGKFKNGKENEKTLKELVAAGDRKFFRTLKNEKMHEIAVWVSLFVNEKKETEEYIKNIKEIAKIEASEEEIKKNITFYEDKKDYN